MRRRELAERLLPERLPPERARDDADPLLLAVLRLEPLVPLLAVLRPLVLLLAVLRLLVLLLAVVRRAGALVVRRDVLREAVREPTAVGTAALSLSRSFSKLLFVRCALRRSAPSAFSTSL